MLEKGERGKSAEARENERGRNEEQASNLMRQGKEVERRGQREKYCTR